VPATRAALGERLLETGGARWRAGLGRPTIQSSHQRRSVGPSRDSAARRRCTWWLAPGPGRAPRLLSRAPLQHTVSSGLFDEAREQCEEGIRLTWRYDQARVRRPGACLWTGAHYGKQGAVVVPHAHLQGREPSASRQKRDRPSRDALTTFILIRREGNLGWNLVFAQKPQRMSRFEPDGSGVHGRGLSRLKLDGTAPGLWPSDTARPYKSRSPGENLRCDFLAPRTGLRRTIVAG
jgi:hypothetical protein